MRIWILGAPDPEMEAIEHLLRDCGERVEYATSDPAGLVRIRPGQRCTLPAALRSGYHGERAVAAGSTWYAVECDVAALRPYGDPYVVIDHHRSGDPGYGRPPAEFLPACSLGQVIAELARLGQLPRTGWPVFNSCVPDGRPAGISLVWFRRKRNSACWIVRGPAPGATHHDARTTTDYARDSLVWRIPHDLVLGAAADHCLGAAYRGECPGVDPDALMYWRAESRARFQERDPIELLRDVTETTAALRAAPTIDLRDHTHDDPAVVRDMRRDPPWPELPEAAARANEAYIAGPLIGPDGRRKYTCAGPKNVIEAFLATAGGPIDLEGMYGDPTRGFAGGYERDR